MVVDNFMSTTLTGYFIRCILFLDIQMTTKKHMPQEKIYRQTMAEYRKMIRNEDRLVRLKEAIKPINKILSQIRSDRMRRQAR